MSNKNNTKDIETTVSGRNVYADGHKTIYHNPLTKTNYIIRKDKAKAFTTFSLRFLIGLITGYGFGLLFKKWWAGLLLVLLVYAVMALIFYFKFLPDLPTEIHFTPYKKPTMIDDLASTVGKGKLISSSLICLGLAAILLSRVVVSYEDSGSLLSLDIILSILVVGFAIVCFIASTKSKKE